ncbi:hypothetical protein [uncultured Amnibacterium sp.]|uniref:hypothetical protein n=1 Tax=uncultured Amnibacterium sp. TaxID=1631851 RepID=UPI0035CB46D8
MTERRHRRVRTPPAPGSDPLPGGEPEQSDSTDSNDEQLRRDVPPHWHAGDED